MFGLNVWQDSRFCGQLEADSLQPAVDSLLAGLEAESCLRGTPSDHRWARHDEGHHRHMSGEHFLGRGLSGEFNRA